MKKTTLTISLILSVFALLAQDNTSSDQTANVDIYKDNSWEVGLHAGHFFTAGNVDFIPGYAGGFHVRRALDYVFSLRADLMYGSAKGEDAGNVRSFENKWTSGTLQSIISLNNLKWSLAERKTNFYFLLGVGLNSFSVDSQKEGEDKMSVGKDLALHSEIGAGLAFRINSHVNLGLEHKSSLVLGSRSDLPDGFQTKTLEQDNRGAFRDILNYTSLRINYNFGKRGEQTEPLYWLNPLDAVLADIRDLIEFKGEMTDRDNDGVIDRVDLDKNTIPGVLVNSKGQTLDSDGDGVVDYQDREPFSPPGFPIDSYGVAQRPDVKEEAERLVDAKLKAFEKDLPPPPTVTMLSDAAIINMTLPTIFYSLNNNSVGGKDLVMLETVAGLMKTYPQLRLTVTGHSDKVGREYYNQDISYWRAKRVIDHLVTANGISRNRLVLQYKGYDEALVEGSHEANRRVQFKVATTETEMAPPK